MIKNIAHLKQVKHYCSQHDDNCTDCIYNNSDECTIEKAIKHLARYTPCNWDIKKLERILKQ